MASSRTIPYPAHAAIETVAAPAIMAAPLLLGFGQAAAVVAFAIGALLLGLAFQAAGPRRTVPISAHAGFDYLLAAVRRCSPAWRSGSPPASGPKQSFWSALASPRWR